MSVAVARSWDREYGHGRRADTQPLAFVDDMLAAARSRSIADGLDIGCGNGRNLIPLVAGGLRMTGIDVSATAISQLLARAPEQREHVHVGDLAALPGGQGRAFGLVVGIQVFQHGDRATAHAHVRRAQERVAPGGLMAVRVNAAATDVRHRHELKEATPDGGFTVRYLQGPKQGLDVRFFGERELGELFSPGFEPLLPLRMSTTHRAAPADGQWSQWEVIWARP